jgi:hypothetical protein
MIRASSVNPRKAAEEVRPDNDIELQSGWAHLGRRRPASSGARAISFKFPTGGLTLIAGRCARNEPPGLSFPEIKHMKENADVYVQ